MFSLMLPGRQRPLEEPPQPAPAPPARAAAPPSAAEDAEQDEWPLDVHLPDETEDREC